METSIKFFLYFILGGTVVSLATYFGSKERGLLAAFVAMIPSVTVLTLSTIYLEAGTGAIISYVKGLLLLTPTWILYLLCLMYLLPKHGFTVALVSGVVVYLVLASLITFRF